jgi:chromosome segregation protein
VAQKLPTDADLTDMLDRLTEHDDLLDDLEERQTQLIAQAEGYDEDKLRAELTDFNSDGVESLLAILENEEQKLERELREIFAAHSEAVRQRANAEQGMGAEVAAQQRSSAEAELVAASREWLLLKFGALLVNTAIDRRRADESDPLLARAGILFAMLTGQSFCGIGEEYDEHDVPQLVGRRPTGQAVKVKGMSTGARDQFYLALRLAYLEEYASRAEPAPFIGDDLFASSDENRTANGLAALAAIGDRVQPIVFTHHRHVADIARTITGAEVIAL